MEQRSLRQVRVSVSLIFLIHGLIIATWASRIPAFQARLHLSPAVLGRSLMMAAIGSVLAMPAPGWLIHKFGSLSMVIGSTLGFALALPLIAESNTVLALSVALLFYGAMAGSMDVAMNTHAVMLEKRYQRHIMSSFHALFSLGGMAGSALGGLVASRAVPAGIHFWVSGIVLAAMSMLAFGWLPLPSAPELRGELRRKIAAHTPNAGAHATAIPGLTLYHRTALSPCYPAMFEPSLNVFVQGRKRITFAGMTYRCDESTFLLSSIDVPVVSQIVAASEDVPLLSLLLKLDMAVVREILSHEEFHARDGSSPARGIAIGKTTVDLLQPFLKESGCARSPRWAIRVTEQRKRSLGSGPITRNLCV